MQSLWFPIAVEMVYHAHTSMLARVRVYIFFSCCRDKAQDDQAAANISASLGRLSRTPAITNMECIH